MVESSYTLLYQPWCSTTPDRRHSNTVIGNFGIPFRDQEKADQKQSTPNQEHRCSCWIRDLTEACCTRWVTHAQRQSILNIPVSKFGILLDTKRGQIIRLLQVRSISEGTRSSRDLHIMVCLLRISLVKRVQHGTIEYQYCRKGRHGLYCVNSHIYKTILVTLVCVQYAHMIAFRFFRACLLILYKIQSVCSTPTCWLPT